MSHNLSMAALCLAFVASLALLIFLPGCAQTASTVATDVQVVEKPVPVPCKITWPSKPTPHVALVQPSGNRAVDALLVWRAAEAELEERIAYQAKLEAAMTACEATP